MDDPMRGPLQNRISSLRAEQSAMLQQVAALDDRAHALRGQLIRIAGAIEVLEELLAAESPD